MKNLKDIKELAESKGFAFHKREEGSIYLFDIIIFGERLNRATEKIITVRENTEIIIFSVHTERNIFTVHTETIIDKNYIYGKNISKESLNVDNLMEVYNYIKEVK